MQHVIFGTGPLGQAVMRALLKRENAKIRMINRSGKRGDIPAEVEVIMGDAYDAATVAKQTQDADVVYQCAQPAYTKWPQQFPPLQSAIIEGVSRGDAKLIVGENLYMYGDTDGQPLDESLPYAATGKKGTTRAAMARQLIDAHEAGKIRVAMARGSDFYGEGVLESLVGERAILPLMQGKPAQFLLGDLDLPHTQTYIGDFGEALAILGERGEALGRAWHVPNAEPAITTRQFIERIAAELGVEPKLSVMPKPLFAILSRLIPIVGEFREIRYHFEKPYIVGHSDFAAAFGDISTPMDTAIRRTVGWYRDTLGQKLTDQSKAHASV